MRIAHIERDDFHPERRCHRLNNAEGSDAGGIGLPVTGVNSHLLRTAPRVETAPLTLQSGGAPAGSVRAQPTSSIFAVWPSQVRAGKGVKASSSAAIMSSAAT